jgi:hypothetical protein
MAPAFGRGAIPSQDLLNIAAVHRMIVRKLVRMIGFCNSMCGAKAVQDTPATLFQIRSAFTAGWNDLRFVVESSGAEWSLRVEDRSSSRTLYSAQRGDQAAAKVACMEFALFQTPGAAARLSPEAAASELAWKNCWMAAA